jgi:hypothetical protein
LIIVDYPHFFKKSLINYFFGFLANIGDKRDIKDIQLKLIDSGFEPLIEEIKDESSSVKLIIADK